MTKGQIKRMFVKRQIENIYIERERVRENRICKGYENTIKSTPQAAKSGTDQQVAVNGGTNIDLSRVKRCTAEVWRVTDLFHIYNEANSTYRQAYLCTKDLEDDVTYGKRR